MHGFSRLFIVASLITGLGACAEAQDAHPISTDLFSGTWQNDRGSHVSFKDSGGLLSGHYQTNVGEPDKSQKFPLTGFAQGDQITFTVNFEGYGSMTSWTGQLSRDSSGPVIQTLWHLTRDVEDADEEDDLWKSITSGASQFRPVM
ncbi:MAG: hypothetical protein HKN36_04815 [Hellea sp.]|nr:hypothetical protein [Hellea sp.]